jgi:glucose/arabinose dehydrogenase
LPDCRKLASVIPGSHRWLVASAFRSRVRWALPLAAAVLLGAGAVVRHAACAAPFSPPAFGKTEVKLAPVAYGFSEITDIQFVPGAGRNAVVLQKGGEARLVELGAPGSPRDAASGRVLFEVDVLTRSELGLLGLAFHPNFRKNGLFYLNYTPKDGTMRSRIAEWKLDPKKLATDTPVEKRIILELTQPYSNHNAGQLVFGPDGMLYIGFGDGGSANDPHGNGQNFGTWLGKMLRIDVDHAEGGKEYRVPPDNPFVGQAGKLPEIWASGLRNPWRYSFDGPGRIVLGDVGQDRFEEIDLVTRGSNLGWKAREAAHCFDPEPGCPTQGITDPIFEYSHEVGQSVTGGLVYQADSIAGLKGKYVFGDFAQGRIWALEVPAQPGVKAASVKSLGKWQLLISTFGRDENGELFVGDFQSGSILQLVPK